MFPTLEVSSLILLAIIFFSTLATAKLMIPRYQSSISQVPEIVDTPGGLDTDLVPYLGGNQAEEVPKPEEEEIVAQYIVSYPKQVYFNQLFWLRVGIGREGVSKPADAERRLTEKGKLCFKHRWFPKDSASKPEPPQIRVELKFNEDEFRVPNNVQVKPLPEKEETVYDFAVKSLKSEDSVLAVEIAYLGSKWNPRKVNKIKITENYGNESIIKTLTPEGIVEDIVVLVRQDLTIQTKSFLNLNAASLSILSKALAIGLTAIYIGIVIGFGLSDDVLSTIIVGISSLASALGIPLAADLWKDAQVKQEKEFVANGK